MCRVQRQHGGGGLVLPRLGLARRHGGIQHRLHPAAQRFAPHRQPGIESRIQPVEPVHQAFVQHRAQQGRVVQPPLRQPVQQPGHIHRHPLAVQRHGQLVGPQHRLQPRPQRLADQLQALAQAGAGLLLGRFGPKQAAQPVAPEAHAIRQRQRRQHRPRLARSQRKHPARSVGNLAAAQQRNAQQHIARDVIACRSGHCLSPGCGVLPSPAFVIVPATRRCPADFQRLARFRTAGDAPLYSRLRGATKSSTAPEPKPTSAQVGTSKVATSVAPDG